MKEKIIKIILAASERETLFPHFLVIGKHDAIIVISNPVHCYLYRNDRDFSNTFCSRFLAATDNRGVTFTAFLSALRTKSSAVAPSKTGIFLIVIAIVINFMQKYYFIAIQQNATLNLTVTGLCQFTNNLPLFKWLF